MSQGCPKPFWLPIAMLQVSAVHLDAHRGLPQGMRVVLRVEHLMSFGWSPRRTSPPQCQHTHQTPLLAWVQFSLFCSFVSSVAGAGILFSGGRAFLLCSLESGKCTLWAASGPSQRVWGRVPYFVLSFSNTNNCLRRPSALSVFSVAFCSSQQHLASSAAHLCTVLVKHPFHLGAFPRLAAPRGQGNKTSRHRDHLTVPCL